jgi:secondary thiamine-phosphate synthase enzyme
LESDSRGGFARAAHLAMPISQTNLTVSTRGTGTYEITDRVSVEVRRSGMKQGLVTVFCRHTSCSLLIFENADPTARSDLEAWMNRLVPSGDPLFTHKTEGPDDMPAHVKMALTRTSENIPFSDGRLQLGSWQGLFLWEHRTEPQQRSLIVTIQGA